LEVADYLFANPGKAKRRHVLEKFGGAWGVSRGTLDRVFSEAKQACAARVAARQEAKDAATVASARSEALAEVASREEVLSIFTRVLRGMVVKRPVKVDGEGNVLEYEVDYPTRRDMLSAGNFIAQLEGWNAPNRQEITGKDGAPIIPELSADQLEKLIDKL
jgi:hypothetical protein